MPSFERFDFSCASLSGKQRPAITLEGFARSSTLAWTRGFGRKQLLLVYVHRVVADGINRINTSALRAGGRHSILIHERQLAIRVQARSLTACRLRGLLGRHTAKCFFCLSGVNVRRDWIRHFPDGV